LWGNVATFFHQINALIQIVCVSEGKNDVSKTRPHPKMWRESTLGVSVK